MTILKIKFYLENIFKKNRIYFVLLLLNMLSAIGGILIYKFIAIKYEQQDVFIFTFLKRIISFISPISLLGLGVTIVRNVSLHSSSKSFKFILIGMLTSLFIPLLITVLYVFFPDKITILIWGENSLMYKEMFLPIILNLLGLNLVSILVSFYRGIDKFVFSTTLGLVTLVLLPFIILIFDISLKTFITIYGFILILVSIFFLFKIKLNFPSNQDKINLVKFIKEGASRMIGDISYYFLLFAPSYFVLVFTKNLSLAAAIAFCQVIINACSILVNPISFMTLTKSVKNTKENKINFLKKDFQKVVKYSFLFFIGLYLFLFFTIEFIILNFFTDQVLVFLNEIKFFLITLPFMAVYLSSRSFIDGLTSKAIMSFINTFGLLIFLSLLFSFKNFFDIFYVIGLAFALSFLMMDLLIIFYVKRIK